MKSTVHRIENDEIPGSAVGLILRGAGAIGVNLDKHLADIAISRSLLDKHLPLPPVPRAQFAPVYRSCMAGFRARVEELHGRSYLSFDCADLLCACILSCKKLEEAIHRTIKFVEILNGRGMQLSLEVKDKQAVLKLRPASKGDSIEEMLCDFFEVCFYYKLFSWLIGEPLVEGNVELTHFKLGRERALEDMMGAGLSLDKDDNAIVFKREMLKRPIVRTARELEEALKVSPIELMPVPPTRKLSVILTGIFRRSLEEKVHIPQVDEVAYQLGQSGPTLRRHLAKENTSFQALVDKCRMEKARELLKNSSLTIDDISYHLGFSAPSGFSRAFKDWTGCAPSIYRQRQDQGEEDRLAVGFR